MVVGGSGEYLDSAAVQVDHMPRYAKGFQKSYIYAIWSVIVSHTEGDYNPVVRRLWQRYWDIARLRNGVSFLYA